MLSPSIPHRLKAAGLNCAEIETIASALGVSFVDAVGKTLEVVERLDANKVTIDDVLSHFREAVSPVDPFTASGHAVGSRGTTAPTGSNGPETRVSAVPAERVGVQDFDVLLSQKVRQPASSGGAGGADPFDPVSLRIDASLSDAALGVERPLLVVLVQKPSHQMFFRVHPDQSMRVDGAVIQLEVERETYLVTPAIARIIPEEIKLVRLLTCLPRIGSPFLWPLRLPTEDGRELKWHVSARKAAEIAQGKWVRMQANMSLGAYDVTTSSHIPDPVWPEHSFKDLLRIAFGDGRLIDREDHPVIRHLKGR